MTDSVFLGRERKVQYSELFKSVSGLVFVLFVI